jgi:acyl-coenzyme A thioesterase PaaI-like protein
VMLTISYLSKSHQGRLRAVGRVTTAGRRLYFASGELRTEDGLLVATAQGTFKLGRPATPPEG